MSLNPPDSILWREKYQVKEPSEFVFHTNLVNSLCSVAKHQQFLNLIFHGPPGSGKLSLARLLLYQLFRDKPDSQQIFNPVAREINLSLDSEISFYKSRYHFEVDLEDYQFNKNIIQQFITEIASNKHFSSDQQFQIILFYNMEKMSCDVQFTLRRTLEMYSDNCRFIFLCHRLSSIEDAIKSRCTLIRVPIPPKVEIDGWIDSIVAKYPHWNVSASEKKKIMKQSGNNLNMILFSLQYIYYQEWQKQNGGLDDTGESIGASYNLAGDPTLDDIFQQSVFLESILKSLVNVNIEYLHNLRNNLYTLLANDMNIDDIFQQTVRYFITSKKVKADKKAQIAKTASYYMINLHTGYRHIYHLESFLLWVYGLLKFDNLPVELLEE